MANRQLFGMLQCLFRRCHLQPADRPSDRTLLDHFLVRQDETAFEALMQRHGPMVLGVCRGILRDAHQAEDALQATFLVLARKAGSVRRQDSVGAWLHRVACRIAWRARTAGARRQFHESQVAAMTALAPADRTEVEESMGLLHEELGRLPDKYRVLLVRCDLQGTTHAQAAEELGVSRVTVTERLSQAREQLRRRLAARGLTMAAALVTTDLADRASASLPAHLAADTLRTALAFARGPAATTVAPAGVALLVDGFLHGTLLSRWLLTAAVLLAIGLASGAGLWLHPVATAQVDAGQNPEAGQSAGANTQVAETEKPGTDLFGDALPAGALYRLGTIRLSHGSPVEQLAFVPGQRLLASAARDGSLRLWDLATGGEVRRFPFFDSNRSRGSGFAFSPDGTILAINQPDHLGFFETATGKAVGRCKGPAFHFAFSRDGRTLLAVYQNCVRHWDVATGRQLREWSHGKDDPNYFYKCAFSPDRRLLAVGDFDQEKPLIHLWDVSAGKLIYEWKAHQSYIRSQTYSPDGKTLISTSDDQTVCLWYGDTGAEKQRWQVGQVVLEASVAPDSGTVALSLPDSMHVRDWPSGRERRRIGGMQGPVAFSADGKTLAAFGGPRVRLWDTVSGKEHNPLPAHPREVSDLKYSPDGQWLVSQADGRLLVWQAATGKPLGSLPGRKFLGFRSGKSIAITSEQADAAAKDWTVYHADVATGKQLAKFQVAAEPNEALAASADGRLVVLTDANNKKLRFWDLAAGKEMRRFEGEYVVRSPDFGKVAVVTEHWGEVSSATLDNPPAKPTCGGNVDVLEAATGKRLCRIPDYAPAMVFKGIDEIDGSTYQGVTFVAPEFSPDGTTLSVAGDSGRAIRLWATATGKELRPSPADDPSQGRLMQRMQAWARERKVRLQRWEFNPDHRLAAAVYSNRTLALWETASGQLIRTWGGYDGDIHALAFAPDGRTLSTPISDGTALLWDVTGVLRKGELPTVTLKPEDVDQLWQDLAGSDAGRAQRAAWRLTAAGPQTASYLRKRLRPAATADPAAVAQLLSQLDSDRFDVREKAKRRLVGLESAKPALQRALAGKPSLELRRRIEAVLADLADAAGSPERLQALRGLAVLERIGSREARQVVETIAQGASEARLTQEARSTLARPVWRGVPPAPGMR